MRVTLSKWGNSLAFRVPKDMARAAGFQEGAPLDMVLENGALVLRSSQKRYDIDEMVEQMRKMRDVEPHPLLLDDPPVGTEFW
jgi:antitoxin MazE